MTTSIQSSIETRCKLKALSVLRGRTQADCINALIDAEIEQLAGDDQTFVQRIIESELALADRRAQHRAELLEEEDRRWSRAR